MRNWFRYFAAAGIAACTYLVAAWLEPLIEPNFEALFLAATVVVAWFLGLGPAMLAMALSIAALIHLFLPPYYNLHVFSWSTFARIGVFVASAVLISWLVHSLEKTRKALAESVNRFSIVIKSSPVVVFSQDENLRYTWIYNPVGRPVGEIVGKSDLELFPSEEAQRLTEIKRKVLSTGSGIRTDVAVKIEGKRYEYDLMVEPVRDSAGTVTGIIGAAVNITEKKRLAERLSAVQKIENIGTITAGLAHQLNNLLTGVVGNLGLAMEQADSYSAHFLTSAQNAAERAAAVVRQLMAYAGKAPFFESSIDLSQMIRNMQEITRAYIPDRIQVNWSLRQELPAITGDRDQLQQVFMNLIANASEAIQNGTGEITIATGEEELDREAIAALDRYGSAAPGRFVYFEVRDTGCGMDANTLANIFDPFFTTKFLGRGLGLAAVEGIVKRHKGVIRVSSRPGQGSTFQVLLPVSARNPQQNA